MSHYVPQIGDSGVTGTVRAAFVSGGGIVVADQVQGVPNTDYSGSNNVPDPLRFVFTSGSFSLFQRVTFSVAQGTYSAVAQNLQLL